MENTSKKTPEMVKNNLKLKGILQMYDKNYDKAFEWFKIYHSDEVRRKDGVILFRKTFKDEYKRDKKDNLHNRSELCTIDIRDENGDLTVEYDGKMSHHRNQPLDYPYINDIELEKEIIELTEDLFIKKIKYEISLIDDYGCHRGIVGEVKEFTKKLDTRLLELTPRKKNIKQECNKKKVNIENKDKLKNYFSPDYLMSMVGGRKSQSLFEILIKYIDGGMFYESEIGQIAYAIYASGYFKGGYTSFKDWYYDFCRIIGVKPNKTYQKESEVKIPSLQIIEPLRNSRLSK